MKLIKKHPFFVIIISVLVVFVAFNLLRERAVERVNQDVTPSVSQVQEVIEKQDTSDTGGTNSSALLGEGTFVDGKPPYSGSGSVTIVSVDGKPVLKFGEDFSATNGPDLQVYLSLNASAKDQGLGEVVTLGALKQQTGAQVYSLPENFKDFASVVVWCRAFQGVFTQAELSFSE